MSVTFPMAVTLAKPFNLTDMEFSVSSQAFLVEVLTQLVEE